MEKKLIETHGTQKLDGFFVFSAIRNHQRKILDQARSREPLLKFEQANLVRQKSAVNGWFLGVAK